jgi:hypothetical protein
VLNQGVDMKTDAMLANELLKVIEQRKALDKRESELKELFKTRMGAMGCDTLSLGGVQVSLVLKSRTGLDGKALIAAFGEAVISQYEKITEYKQVDVKREDAACEKVAA